MKRHRLLILKNHMSLGGAETLILQHVKHLNRDVFDVHVITLTKEGTLLEDLAKHADVYECFDVRFHFSPLSLIRLAWYIRSNKIDLVHCHDWVSALYLVLSSSRSNARRVLTIHAKLRSWRQNVLSYLVKHFDLIISVTRQQQLSFFELGAPWEKLAVVHNCIDSERFPLRRRTVSDKTGAANRVVMVGNFYWQKDQMTLVEAVRVLSQRGCDLELHLVGGSNDENLEACKARVRDLDLEARVFFHGQERVHSEFLSSFDLFTFSSRSEQFGIVILEAMASGLPVLVSDIPASMEVIGHGRYGFFFETGNVESCAREIGELLVDPSRLGSKTEDALEYVQSFTSEVITRKLEERYLRLLSESLG
ncbi:glycosyltransferase family 4 protein [Gemmatimonadota bacterium]